MCVRDCWRHVWSRLFKLARDISSKCITFTDTQSILYQIELPSKQITMGSKHIIYNQGRELRFQQQQVGLENQHHHWAC